MNESLRAAQHIHYGLCLVSAAIIVLGFSERAAEKYEKALDELTALQRVELEALSPALVRDAEAGLQRRDTMIEIALLQRLNVGPMPSVMEWFPSDDPLSSVPASLVRHRRLSVQATLAQLEEYVRENPPVLLLRIGELRGDTMAVADSLGCPPVGRGLLNFESGERVRYCPLTRMAAAYDSARSFSLAFNVVDGPGRMHRRSVWFAVDTTPLPALTPRYWLEHADTLGRLFSADGRLLPQAHRVWSSVKDLTPVEASDAVAERLASTRKGFSFLGVQLDERLAVVGGPALLLVTLVLFGFHVKHAGRVLRPDNLQEARGFAWSPLFPGWQGTAVALLSALLLPLFAALAIGWRAWPGLTPPTRLLVVASAAGVCAAGIHVVHGLRRLRKSIQDGTAEPSTLGSTP